MARKISDVSEGRAAPLPTSVSLLAMIAIAGLIALNFVSGALAAANGTRFWANVVLLLVSFLISVAVPILAALLIRRGHPLAPLLVTAVALWGCLLLLISQDVVTWISALIGVAGSVAVWLPASRIFLRERRLKLVENKKPATLRNEVGT